jgi:hypothetical protein
MIRAGSSPPRTSSPRAPNPWDHMNRELPKIPEMPPLPDTELFRIRQG